MVSIPEESTNDNPLGDTKYSRSDILGDFDYVL